MIVKPFQFIGTCQECNEPPADGAVAFAIGEDGESDDEDIFDIHDWLCLDCAMKLARRIRRACRRCTENIEAGKVFRDGRWVKPS